MNRNHGGTNEKAQQIVHESPGTIKLDDRSSDRRTPGEIERIVSWRQVTASCPRSNHPP